MLDVHEGRQGKVGKHLFGISDRDFEILEPTFDRFHKKTGARIDPYGDLKLTHLAGVLLEHLNQFLRQEKDPRRMECAIGLCAVLEEAIASQTELFFLGD